MKNINDAINIFQTYHNSLLDLKECQVSVSYSIYQDVHTLVNRNPISKVLLITICTTESKNLRMSELLGV